MSDSSSNERSPEQATLEEGLKYYLVNLQKVIISSLESSGSTTTKLVTTLYSQIEEGGKELAVYRELLLYMSNNNLTQEKWDSIVGRLDKLKKEKETSKKE